MSDNDKETFLIVDDSVHSREKLKYILENNNYMVVGEASNGEDAIEQYKKLVPDIVTMDIMMPGTKGTDVLKKILEFDPGAVVIMVSSWGTQKFVMEAIETGAKNFLVKPFNEKQMVEIIKHTLKKIES